MNSSAIDSSDVQHRTTIRAVGSGRMWCSSCERQVSVVTIEQASTLTNLPVDVVFDRIKGRSLHSRRRLSGDFLVCLESLLQVFKVFDG